MNVLFLNHLLLGKGVWFLGKFLDYLKWHGHWPRGQMVLCLSRV